MSPRVFLILPAVVPFALDIALTLWGQPAEYWAGSYSHAAEMAPVGRALLQYHPLAFVAAAIGYAGLFSLAIRFLPGWIALWLSLGYLLAHTSGANSWLIYQDVRLEALHNVGMSGFAALCFSLYFRRSRIPKVAGKADEAGGIQPRPDVAER
ncbi:MAG TPA: hypothetical protein VGN57_07885 [Pirellulaceae bacterium]|nr:hypothetical protein [Pirellulaceae bacterium]